MAMRIKSKVAVIGYGTQGRAWARNLHDSGCNITIGLPSKSKSQKIVKRDFPKPATTISRAIKNSDMVIFAFPDHLHGSVYKKDIEPYLKDDVALIFLCGYSIHFKVIIPPPDSDIILLAPLGPGSAVREVYLKNESIRFFYSIFQNGTGNAEKTLRYLTKNLKIGNKSLINTTFKDEAIGDIFGEQAVICGGLTQLIKSGYETLTESGLSSDKAYLEVAYQLDLIVDLIKRYGIEGMYRRISVAAKYGSYLSGRKIIDSSVKKRMKEALREIKNGNFADKLNKLSPSQLKQLDKNLKKMSTPTLETSARKFSKE
jgi:ketol-acid reductoisomerase